MPLKNVSLLWVDDMGENRVLMWSQVIQLSPHPHIQWTNSPVAAHKGRIRSVCPCRTRSMWVIIPARKDDFQSWMIYQILRAFTDLSPFRCEGQGTQSFYQCKLSGMNYYPQRPRGLRPRYWTWRGTAINVAVSYTVFKESYCVTAGFLNPYLDLCHVRRFHPFYRPRKPLGWVEV